MRNNISKHIEKLLLTNDRVAIPSFGVFNVTHVPAEYVEATGLFYPPKRVVDFVIDKSAYDTLLLQSYADALDISMPEAQRVMENDVCEVQVQLQQEGEYYFHGIGTLTKYEDKTLGFEADIAGIATPSLFGLNSFEFKPLQAQIAEPAKKAARIISIAPFGQHTSLTPLRKVAAAAVAVFVGFSFVSIPVGNGSDNTKVIQASILSSDVINSIVESPTSHNVAVTQEEIAQFEQAANYKEVQEEAPAKAPQVAPTKETKTTQVITAAPTTVNVNISYDDMKKVVEEHEQETVVHEKDSLS
jgi:hypothetical protein